MKTRAISLMNIKNDVLRRLLLSIFAIPTLGLVIVLAIYLALTEATKEMFRAFIECWNGLAYYEKKNKDQK